MRNIKFRGKMIPENEWIYGTLLRIPHPPVYIGKEEIDKYYIQFADPRYMPDWNMPYKMVQGEVIPNTIGQYTGLKDKNGQEIYEGDMIKIPEEYELYGINAGEIYEVYFAYGGFRLKPKYNSKARGYYLEDNNEVEVVGNIYDNPKLLAEKE